MDVEMLECFPVTLPLFEDGLPAQPGLSAFEDEKFKQKAVVMNGYAPFIVMVRSIERIVSAPSASLLHVFLPCPTIPLEGRRFNGVPLQAVR